MWLVCAAAFCQCNLDVDYVLPVVHLITIDSNNTIELKPKGFIFPSIHTQQHCEIEP